MKIAIEARAATGLGGVGTYVRELLRHLSRGGDASYVAILDHEQKKIPGITSVVVPRLSDLTLSWWLNHQVPAQVRKIDADVIHFTKAAVPKHKRRPTVVTIFDVIPIIFPESQQLTRRWYWPRALRRAVLQSDRIITISEASKRDIVQHLGASAEAVTVTPLACDTTFFKHVSQAKTVVEQQFHLSRPYILYVGTIEPRKNVGTLVRAFSKISDTIPHDLVIVGKMYKGESTLLKIIEESGVAARIKVLSYVSREYLPALYSAASVFVWPSIYEGWGFPPQEAMACGAPVIVSDGGSLPEVVGTAAKIVRFSTSSVAERLNDVAFQLKLETELITILHDTAMRESMGVNGRAQAESFSWSSVAEKTHRVYQELSRV